MCEPEQEHDRVAKDDCLRCVHLLKVVVGREYAVNIVYCDLPQPPCHFAPKNPGNVIVFGGEEGK